MADSNGHDDINNLEAHVDPAPVTVTYMQKLDPAVADGFVTSFKRKVQTMHATPEHKIENARGNKRAQTFEEGEVAMAVEPSQGFASDLYVMDFFDTRTREICARMHKHTGQRFVIIYTGSDTRVQTSSLSPIVVRDTDAVIKEDTVPLGTRKRYTYEVPPNSVVAVQIPMGVSHQFNAIGSNALIMSTHVEEMPELGREELERPDMTRQTIFLQGGQPNLQQCGIPQDVAKKVQSALQQFLLKQNAHGFISAIQAAKQIKDSGTDCDSHRLHSMLRTLETEGSPDVKRMNTVGTSTTLLVKESALEALKERYVHEASLRAGTRGA